jgi:hypothetical protein
MAFNSAASLEPPACNSRNSPGDDAVYVETSRAALYVKKGSFVFQIRVQRFPLEQIKAKERTLAQDVLAKL